MNMKKKLSVLLAAILVLSLVGTSYAAPKRGKFRGTVQELDLQKQTFQLKSEKQAWKVIFNEETVFINDGEKADPSQLKNDLGVLVSGVIAEDEKSITAQVVAWGPAPGNPNPGPGDPNRGGPPLIKGIMDKLNLQTLSFELKHKDPEGNERIFQVSFSDKTRFVRDMKPSKAEEFKNGEEVFVMGPVNPEEMKMEAHLVAFGKFERPGDPNPGPGDPGRGNPPVPVEGIKGIVTEINLQQMTLKLKLNEEITLEVKYYEWTGFIRGNRFVFPEELKIDTRVTLYGPVSREQKTAKAHYIVW
jgi:hypothetical protein